MKYFRQSGGFTVLAFIIGLAFGLSFTLTALPQRVEIAEIVTTPIPTATPHVCPPLPEPCPTILYSDLPDVSRIEYLEGQVNSCTCAYLAERQSATEITLALVKQALCDISSNCSSCVVMTEGRYDWCFTHAYYP